MLPAFEIVARHRPVDVVGTVLVEEQHDGAQQSSTGQLPLLAPFAAVEVSLSGRGGGTTASLAGPDGTQLSSTVDQGRVFITTRSGDDERVHRSRRHGQVRRSPGRLALALTGTHVAALTLEDGAWVVRARVDLSRPGATLAADVRDPAWLTGLVAGWSSTEAGTVTGWRAGTFGQLGLRDVRLVTWADGTPYRLDDGSVMVSATSAGPGFFGTAHTSTWTLDAQGEVRRGAVLFFQRPDRPGGYGDHATHVVRDGDRWLVATSTWSDFPADPRARRGARVGVTLAETTTDLTRGQHLLPTRALALPTDGPSVGVWDPHLVRDDDGSWLVGYVSARKFFDFHPVLASGPTLDELSLRRTAGDRTATEGTTLVRLDGAWRVLASDGRDNRRAVRGRFPVFDTDLREVGTIAAPYPTNIPWPTLVPPDPAVPGDRWRLVTFNGRPLGGPLAGYGTHGDLVVMRERD
ncbi:hypothetical protein L615_008000000100 [Nocardioides sp. J9]|uniref:hypothetical protein n=1 Tax=Nocardioides sp. J9 TaxID=935844 RepID=UPI00119CEBBC|nr:hypothetical protein [Nocardioides sp. J9]TWG91412.1 hypothetical protein L615_008000000100 [Nocardioides sp. J9]